MVEFILPYSQASENERVQNWTLYGRGEMHARKRIIALGVTWSQECKSVLRVKNQNQHEIEEGTYGNNG